MKIRIILDGTRYYLRNVSDPVVHPLIERAPGKPVYFTKRGAAEGYIAARAAQNWEQV